MVSRLSINQLSFLIRIPSVRVSLKTCYLILKPVFKTQSKHKRAQRVYNFPWLRHSKTQDTKAIWPFPPTPCYPFYKTCYFTQVRYLCRPITRTPEHNHARHVNIASTWKKTWITAQVLLGCITFLCCFSILTQVQRSRNQGATLCLSSVCQHHTALKSSVLRKQDRQTCFGPVHDWRISIWFDPVD